LAPRLVLFDDTIARQWDPFTLTRPAGELRFGAWKLVERVERALGLDCIGHITADHLDDFSEPAARSVLRIDELARDRDHLFWCSRAAVELDQTITIPEEPAIFLVDGGPVGLYVPAGQRPDDGFLTSLDLGSSKLPEISVAGHVLDRVWDLTLETPDQLIRDLATLPDSARDDLPAGVYCLGAHPLILGQGVRIEPGTVFDTRGGPISVGDGAEIRAGTRLAGPSAVGPHSRLLGDSFERISTGPYSYLHGEVSDTVVLGYSNKAHDGYIGHAYLGKWVNLGAFTTNSDLKNNYRPVRIQTPSGVENTGRIKVGCFLGDHVKTGIGLLLSTGTVVGAGANLYGSVMPPSYVEPFSWGQGDNLGEYRLAEFLDAAQTAMVRRGVELDERGRRFLEACWRKGRGG